MLRSKRFRAWRARIVRSTAVASLLSCATPLAAGELLPASASVPVALRLSDLDGQDRSLAEFKGRVVLVNFWASWCSPCIKEMPSIQRLARTMRGKPFAIIGVNVAETELRVTAAVRRPGIEFPVLLDKDSAVFKRWGATVLPTTYVLDENGMVRYVGQGPLEWDGAEATEMLEQLVKGGAAPMLLP